MRAVFAAVIAAALLVPAAAAAPVWQGNKGQLDRSIAYLQRAQDPDGGYGRGDGTSDETDRVIFSSWIAMALAAGGVNPQDQTRDGGPDLYSFLAARADKLTLTTDFERAMLVAIAAGTSPRDFGTRDLVAAILARQGPDGSFPHVAGGPAPGVNDTAFALIALSAVDEPAARDAVQRAADWLVSVQRPGGGWAGSAPTGSIDTDMTGAVIQALLLAGGDNSPRGMARRAAVQGAQDYLRELQAPDGGFPSAPGDESNTASTAWVVQAMWAAGIDPQTWKPAGSSPLDYLASMQQPDGSIRWKASTSSNDVWMTAYAVPAFAGQPWPIPTVPRAIKVADPPTGRDGVTAGGGGAGAPLFSRPQPQSKGDASGGVRQVAAPKKRRTATKRAPRAATVASGTAQSNGAASRGVTPVASTRRRHRGAARRPPATPRTSRAPEQADGRPAGGADEAVTGRLLTAAAVEPAPTGVSGAGGDTGVAPGLRSAPPRDAASTAAIVIAALLAAAAVAGARIETDYGRKGLA